MSVVAIINNAQNELDENFSIPIASERFFNKYWKKAIEELQLEFLSQVEYGLEFGIEELPYVIDELIKVNQWGKDNLAEKDTKILEERIALIIKKLPEAFRNEKNIIFIG